MRHFVRLLCPEGGEVLDAFCGSGTTGVAAILEGMHFTGIEEDAEGEGFVEIARARCQWAAQNAGLAPEDGEPAGGPQQPENAASSTAEVQPIKGRRKRAVTAPQASLFAEE
jgi:hypothetical protein